MSGMEHLQNVQELLPHRSPMLMVDRILSLEEDRCTAIKCVSSGEPALQGHFPGDPVFPGTLLLEALAQTCALPLIRKHLGHTPIFAGVENARFRRPVTPGDLLRLEGVLAGEKKGFYTFDATAYVDSAPVCTAVLTITMR